MVNKWNNSKIGKLCYCFDYWEHDYEESNKNLSLWSNPICICSSYYLFDIEQRVTKTTVVSQVMAQTTNNNVQKITRNFYALVSVRENSKPNNPSMILTVDELCLAKIKIFQFFLIPRSSMILSLFFREMAKNQHNMNKHAKN